MSTPSTATATIPATHPHYGYSHHQNYTPSGGYHPNAALLNGSSSRLGTTHYSFPITTTTPISRRPTSAAGHSSSQPQQPPPPPPLTPQNALMATSQAPSNHHESSSSRQERKPNWAEFYKHGIPKEVIVIDDDDDSPPPAPVPVPATQYDSRPNANARTVTLNQSTRHADKKRKTAVSTGYDPIYNPAPSYSTTQTPHYINSPSAASISTDRTASALHTTAATSLGSHASINNGLYMPHAAAAAAAEDGVVGQKRKRTRKAVADEAKRRESDVQGDPWSCYVPPPNPPLKARDVHVQVMPDTSYMKHQKVDDDDGHFIVVPDSELGDRYQITKLLGQGTFGKVVEAYDRKKRSKCAIKIIRSVQKYRDASRIELRVLRTLSANDVENRNKCIHLRDCFDYRNHICIVTDLLGQSVFDFLKANQFVPFPSSQIQNFARQLFTSVAFLHDLNLIHTDLKPENILLVNSQYQTFTYNRTIPSSSTATSRQARQRRVLLDSEIRLIDFGSATFDDEYHSSVVSTRHYRAPEIILNLGWSFPCDIWSIGCILVEFFTGDALFQTHDNLEHLAMMEPVCGGRLDTKLVKQVMAGGRGSNGNQAAKYFVRGQRLDYPNNETTRASRKYVKAMKQLHEIIPQTTTFNKQFLDLLRKIFVYDPRQRITAKQALKHPWFRESIVDDGTEATRIRMERERQVNGYR